VTYIIRTFRALSENADFTDVTADPAPAHGESAAPSPQVVSVVSTGAEQLPTPSKVQGITVNVNIQLVLPETKDDSVYDSFFRALRQHLLS